MLKHGGDSTMEMLTQLMNYCRQDEQVPMRDRQDGVIVKLQKKDGHYFTPCYLRRILKVRWQDLITNEEVIRRAKSKALGDIITGKRMQLAG
ncbi:Hypp2935 [Branchiostoma lanceolatum]|uniref:Hypp2935 protein n=1 Tax=Branchiostoma lanceolatum TaxID=7740 RepID=A0A8J9ZVJ8_BRALA|nr:Hypp2935 [Branchiostoma lanceolatum]